MPLLFGMSKTNGCSTDEHYSGESGCVHHGYCWLTYKCCKKYRNRRRHCLRCKICVINVELSNVIPGDGVGNIFFAGYV